MFFKKFMDRFLKSTCILCGGDAVQHFCTPCLQDLPILSHHCKRCAKFLPAYSDAHCGSCIQHPPSFDLTFALFPYEPPIVQLIIALKFQAQLSVAEALGVAFASHIEKNFYKNNKLPDLILPMPLHPQRLQERGFNQALEIAKPISRLHAIPIDTTGLKRTKYTQPQSGLRADERKQNIANAFTAYRSYEGLTVIDDVITTGNTITACCHALKSHGAEKIHVWCVARRG